MGFLFNIYLLFSSSLLMSYFKGLVAYFDYILFHNGLIRVKFIYKTCWHFYFRLKIILLILKDIFLKKRTWDVIFFESITKTLKSNWKDIYSIRYFSLKKSSIFLFGLYFIHYNLKMIKFICKFFLYFYFQLKIILIISNDFFFWKRRRLQNVIFLVHHEVIKI